MPTTFVGLLLFVLLLAPGLTYRAYRAPNVAVRRLSALREVGGVALRSIIFDTIALVAFGFARLVLTDATPDVGALVRDHGAYLQKHYLLTFWWTVGVLAFACVSAVIVAVFIGSNKADAWRASPRCSWMLPRGAVTEDSAWQVALGAHPDKDKHVGLMLDDGHYIDGFLWTFSADTDETVDRDIALQKPRLREPGSSDLNDMDGIDGIVVSARSIRAVTVAYLDKQP